MAPETTTLAPAPATAPLAAAPRRAALPVTAPAVTKLAVRLAGEDRRRMIAEAAYYRAEQRGFVPGNELADWLAAELEVDALLGADERA